MATATIKPDWRRIVRQGLLAGLVGAIVLAAFLYVAFFTELHGSLAALFKLDAENIHATSPWIGALAHLCVSLGWGIGYSYLADTRPRILNTPWLSGFVYGLLVWFIMQLVLMAGEVWHASSMAVYPLIAALVAHAFFFGIPVALTVRAQRR
jgi:hypothetical protein